MPSRKIEQQLAELGLLRTQDSSSETEAVLRKALKNRSNVVAAKAANVCLELELRGLRADLLAAFEYFLEDAAERDPQCWGKNALAKALKGLDYRESDLFLRGLRHIQMEPVWGGRQDTATTLRATCALALVQVTDLPRREIFRHLIEALADEAAPVRIDATRAIEQMEGEEAALLLRLRAKLGDAEPSVVGQAFDSLLKLEGNEAVSLVASFLSSPDADLREEAALSLGASHLEAAVETLTRAWQSTRSVGLRQVILRALGTSKHESGHEFLLEVIRNGREQDARDALAAFGVHRGRKEIMVRLTEAAAARTEPAIRASLNELLRDQ